MRLPLEHVALALFALPTNGYPHDWYTGKTDPVLQHDCCGDDDCRSINPENVRNNTYGYYVETEDKKTEWFIPRNRVQISPDDLYHICERTMAFHRMIIPHLEYETHHRFTWTCFFAPMGTGSIQSGGQ